jgi:predicted NUDIX family NTP pyrophosphohydrolase
MKKSAGILIYRSYNKEYEVFLVHPGGTYWAKKDIGTWSIPKGEFNEDEEPLAAAKRELKEETGITIEGKFIELEPVKQNPAKIVLAWAIEGDCDAANIISNTFEMEWPPKSGKMQCFPEVDKAGWFTIKEAKKKILPGQIGLLEQLEKLLDQ